MAELYFSKVENPKLYKQDGKIHGSSPLEVARGAAINIIGSARVANGLTILPLGDGTWVNAADMTKATLPPPPSPSTGKPIYLTAHYDDGSSERYVPAR